MEFELSSGQREQVAAVLDEPTTAAINFHLEGLHVNGNEFWKIASLIKRGTIRCYGGIEYIDGKKFGGDAKYFARDKILCFSTYFGEEKTEFELSNPYDQSMVVDKASPFL